LFSEMGAPGWQRYRGAYDGFMKPVNIPLKIIILCCIANFINSADRVLMPITIISMADEFNWDMHTQGWILSSFSVGYLSSLIAGGSAAKKYGGKRVLTLAVFLWSISAFFTPYFASSWMVMVFFRFLLGVGEGIGKRFHPVNFVPKQVLRNSNACTAAMVILGQIGLPTIFHIFAYAVSPEERGRAFSYLIAMGSIGQTAAGLISPHIYWPLVFFIFGGTGLIWVALWILFTKSVVECELDAQEYLAPPTKVSEQSTPWRECFTRRPLWAIYCAHFSMNWSNYIIMQWLPTYLVRFLGGGPTEIMLTALPYVANSLCGIAAGHFADNLVRRRWSVLCVRRLMTCIGLVGPGLLLVVFSASSSIPVAVFLISLSMGFSACNSAGHLSSHAEVAPNHAGITFAISNTLATIPGILCGPLTAHIVVHSNGRWFPVFILAGFINIVGAVVYASHSSATPVI
uniref:MFS domain-containing protein n=1 Tax=Schistocephalus solidus TaxID=70667 RepID=A0A183TC79_SCHSO